MAAIKGEDIIVKKHLAEPIDQAEQYKSVIDATVKSVESLMVAVKAFQKTGRGATTVTEINNVTNAYNKSNAAIQAQILLDQQLKNAEDSVVKGKLRLQQASATQRTLLKEEIALEDKQIGTLKRLTIENARLRRERDGLNLSTKEGTQRTKEINAQLDRNNEIIRRSSDSQKKQALNVGNYKSAVNGLRGALGQLGIAFSVFTLAKDAFKTVVDFEKATASLSAITGATGSGLEDLKGKVMDLAQTMKISAIDATKLFEIVGSQMPQLLKDSAGLAKVAESAVTLSKASGDTVEESTRALANVMNQFSLGADQASRTMNILAAGSLVGSAGISDVSESMKNFGSVAAGANISVEESVALIEVLGKFGLVGAEAGTKLRGSILKLQQAGMGYASGQFEINDALEEARKKMEKYGTALEQDAFLQKTFGAENISTGRILLANTALFDEYTKGVTGTNVATEQAAINSDTMSVALDEMKAAWENAIIEVNSGTGAGEGFKEVIKEITKIIPPLVRGLGEILKNVAELIKLVGGMKNSWSNAFNSLKDFKTALADTVDVLLGWIPGVKTATDYLWRQDNATKELTKSTKEQTQEQNRANYTNEQAIKYGKEILQQNKEEISDISVLIDGLMDENTTRAEKNEIIAKLNSDYPELLANIDLETAGTEQLIAVKKMLLESLLQEAIERKKIAVIADISNRIIEKEVEKIGANEAKLKLINQELEDLYTGFGMVDEIAAKIGANVSTTIAGLDMSENFRKTNDEVSALQNTLTELNAALLNADSEQEKISINARIDEANKKLALLLKTRQVMLDDALDKERQSTDGTTTSGGGSGGDSDKKKKELDELEILRKKHAEELLKIENEMRQFGYDQATIEEALLQERKKNLEDELGFIKNNWTKYEHEYEKTLNERLKLQSDYHTKLQKAEIKNLESAGIIASPENNPFVDAMIAANEKIAQDEQEALERRKKFTEDTINLIKKITDAMAEEMDRRIEIEKNELAASKDKIDYLQEQANLGNTDAAESIKAETIAMGQQALEIERLEKKKRNLLIVVTGLELASQNINKGDQNAIQNAGTSIADFIAKLPKFYEGTEGTVAEALGRPHLPGRDGYLTRVDGTEMVLNGGKVDALRAAGLNTTSDVAQAALAYSSGIMNRRSVSGPENAIIEMKNEIVGAIKEIDFPVQDINYNELDKMLTHRLKYKDKIINNHYKNNGLFS